MTRERITPRKVDQLLAKIKPRPVVALVDDDPATLDLLQRALHDEGYEIYRFTKAEDLLSALADIQPDAIVMEVILPGMNGLSVLEELQPENPEEAIPVLILTKKEDPRTKLLAFRRGAFDYVTKPFDAEEVAARVHSLVRIKLTQEMLRESSISDPLTSVYNRRFLLNWLGREIARVKRYGMPLSCLAVALDHLKAINEENGESFGDFVLRHMAKLMTENIRQSDIVGRLREDEFLVFLPGTSKEQATVVARRLRHLATDKGFQRGRQKAQPTLSIGIVGCDTPSSMPSSEVFLEKAGEALGKAKAIGIGETAVLGVD